MLLKYKGFGDRIQNRASSLRGSSLQYKIKADGTWTISYLGDGIRDIRGPMPVYQLSLIHI